MVDVQPIRSFASGVGGEHANGAMMAFLLLFSLLTSFAAAQEYPDRTDLRIVAIAESNHTCGTPPEDFYYLRSDGTFERRVCNSSARQLAHEPELMFDSDPSGTWWQSRNGLETAVFTVNLTQPYELVYFTLVLANYPPVGLAYEKSTDYGRTYVPLEYQVRSTTDCMDVFNVSYQPIPATPSTVVCVQSLPNNPPFQVRHQP